MESSGPAGQRRGQEGHRCGRRAGRRWRTEREHRQAFWEAIDWGRRVKRGCPCRGWRVTGGRDRLVKLAACQRRGSESALVGICRSRRRSARRSHPSSPWRRGEGDRRHCGPLTVHESRGGSRRREQPRGDSSSTAGEHRPVASGPSSRSAEGIEAGCQRAAAPYVQDRLSGRSPCRMGWTGARAHDAVERTTPRPPTGPALGHLVEPRGPEIARRPLDFPDDESMRKPHTKQSTRRSTSSRWARSKRSWSLACARVGRCVCLVSVPAAPRQASSHLRS